MHILQCMVYSVHIVNIIAADDLLCARPFPEVVLGAAVRKVVS